MSNKNSRPNKRPLNIIKKIIKRIMRRLIIVIGIFLFIALLMFIFTVVLSAVLSFLKSVDDASKTFIESFIYHYSESFNLLIKINSIVCIILFSIIPIGDLLDESQDDDEDK